MTNQKTYKGGKTTALFVEQRQDYSVGDACSNWRMSFRFVSHPWETVFKRCMRDGMRYESHSLSPEVQKFERASILGSMPDARKTSDARWSMHDARSFNFGCSMPDARWSSDARCPMHGELRMPDGRCTDAHETLAFHLINGSQNVSSKHHFWVNRKHLCVEKINTSKWEKKKDWWYFKRSKKKATFTVKNSRLSSAFFLYWTIIRVKILWKSFCVTILWKSLKQATISIRQYLVETKSFLRVNFLRKKNICLVGTKSFLRVNFLRKKIIRLVGTKSFLRLNFRWKKVIRFVGWKRNM